MNIRSTFITLWSFVLAVFTPAPTLQPAAKRSNKAATFIEYALLAGIALVLFFLFRTQLGNIFGDLFDRIKTAISG